MNIVFNPVKPKYSGHESPAYWDEADRYTDEYLLQEAFKEKESEEENAST